MSGASTDAALSRPNVLGVGTVVWLASELMFFAGLFAGYFYLRQTGEWPPAGVELQVGRTALFTVVLLASSGTMHLATRAAEHLDRRGAVRWTLATVALGAAFLANQAAEYAELDFTIGSHAYGSIFYLLTGFHGLHVLGGLLLMLAVVATGAAPRSRMPLAGPMTATEYYWHFVDVVWIGVFVSVYLIR